MRPRTSRTDTPPRLGQPCPHPQFHTRPLGLVNSPPSHLAAAARDRRNVPAHLQFSAYFVLDDRALHKSPPAPAVVAVLPRNAPLHHKTPLRAPRPALPRSRPHPRLCISRTPDLQNTLQGPTSTRASRAMRLPPMQTRYTSTSTSAPPPPCRVSSPRARPTLFGCCIRDVSGTCTMSFHLSIVCTAPRAPRSAAASPHGARAPRTADTLHRRSVTTTRSLSLNALSARCHISNPRTTDASAPSTSSASPALTANPRRRLSVGVRNLAPTSL
ncbi:hypothetical protein DFH06DRAFT_1259601 [Mycena polygramma]|nr:hypothetical protein DFH06DRAFT_1259601 [Mycena polygramma]